MNQGLLITLLCGDQCHCWEVGHRKLEKSGAATVHVTNGVKGTRVIN